MWPFLFLPPCNYCFRLCVLIHFLLLTESKSQSVNVVRGNVTYIYKQGFEGILVFKSFPNGYISVYSSFIEYLTCQISYDLLRKGKNCVYVNHPFRNKLESRTAEGVEPARFMPVFV